MRISTASAATSSSTACGSSLHERSAPGGTGTQTHRVRAVLQVRPAQIANVIDREYDCLHPKEGIESDWAADFSLEMVECPDKWQLRGDHPAALEVAPPFTSRMITSNGTWEQTFITLISYVKQYFLGVSSTQNRRILHLKLTQSTSCSRPVLSKEWRRGLLRSLLPHPRRVQGRLSALHVQHRRQALNVHNNQQP